MSNPTTGVWQLQSNLNGQGRAGPVALTGVDPIRYSNGLWLEEGATNIVRNPVMGTNTTGWAAGDSVRETSLPGPLPGYLSDITTCVHYTASTDRIGTSPTCAQYDFPAGLPAGVNSAMVWLWIPASYTGSNLRLNLFNFVGATGTLEAFANLSLRDQWQLITLPNVTISAGDTNGSLRLGTVTGGSVFTGDQVYVIAGCEHKAYATSLAVGSIGAGFAWTSTDHASTSTRAASSAAISPSGILSPASGAIAVRTTPTIETGVEEIWGECGVKGSGTDHARWGRDATKHPFVEWSSNDAAYQRLTASETTDALAKQTIIIGHDGTTQQLQVENGSVQSAARAAASGSWGAGNLVLESSKGGVIYDGFMTADRPLTSAEATKLVASPEWTMSTLASASIVRLMSPIVVRVR